MIFDNCYTDGFEVTGNAQVADMSTGFGQQMTYEVEEYGLMSRGQRQKIGPGGRPDDPWEEIPDDIVPEEKPALEGDVLVLGVIVLAWMAVKLFRKLF